jgi:demethylmenaquinone methyltransferase/2-methoxy-6-polyprenyl-1,4-benzoquinol methylase
LAPPPAAPPTAPPPPAPPAARVVGVDFAGAMLRVGRQKIRARQLEPAVTLVRGDATQIPLPDRSVDGVTIGFGIRNVEDTAAACGEIFRVMTPGGRLAILEFAVPTLPVVKQAYNFYFTAILPAIGKLVSRHNAAYGYLPASVGAFASPDEFVKLLRQSGFSDVNGSPLTFGIVYLYTAQKPLASR